MAPELATPQGRADARSDIYELGACFYHMVTGRPPFEGNSPLQILMRMAQEEAPPAQAVNPGVPPAVSDVIRKTMAPEPDDRYGSIDEVLADLDRATAAVPAPAAEPAAGLEYPAAEAVPEGVPGRPVPVRRRGPRRGAPRGRGGRDRRRGEPARRGRGREAGARGRAAGGRGRREKGEDREERERYPARPAGGGGAALGIVILLVFLAVAAVAIIFIVRKQKRMREEAAQPAPPARAAPVVTPPVGPAPARPAPAPAPARPAPRPRPRTEPRPPAPSAPPERRSPWDLPQQPGGPAPEVPH
jgi:serine/threonine-protein kinase